MWRFLANWLICAVLLACITLLFGGLFVLFDTYIYWRPTPIDPVVLRGVSVVVLVASFVLSVCFPIIEPKRETQEDCDAA